MHWFKAGFQCEFHFSDCGPNNTTITLAVRVEFKQVAVRMESSYHRIIRWSKSYRDEYNSLTTEVEASGSFKLLFSASARVAFNKVTRNIRDDQNYTFDERSNMTEYQEGTLQIVRKLTTVISIDGHDAQSITEEIVHTTTIDDRWTMKEIRKNEQEYISYNYGDSVKENKGKISGSVFTERICVEKNGKIIR